MDIRIPNARAELALTLAQAFLPPKEFDTADCLQLLSDDLEDLGRELAIDLAGPLARFRVDSSHLGNAPLLVHYSRLFLSPPVAARLNLGWYIDGSHNGPLQDVLAEWYAAREVDRTRTFHDLRDHLAVMLEFLGLLESRNETASAAGFVRHYLAPAIPDLERDIVRAGMASPYASLSSWMLDAFAALYPRSATQAQRQKPFANRAQRPGWMHCTQCGAPIATARDLAVMRKALESSGLPAAHLDLCPDCRGTAQTREPVPLHGNA